MNHPLRCHSHLTTAFLGAFRSLPFCVPYGLEFLGIVLLVEIILFVVREGRWEGSGDWESSGAGQPAERY